MFGLASDWGGRKSKEKCEMRILLLIGTGRKLQSAALVACALEQWSSIFLLALLTQEQRVFVVPTGWFSLWQFTCVSRVSHVCSALRRAQTGESPDHGSVHSS